MEFTSDQDIAPRGPVLSGQEREEMGFDVLIVGAGPAGLAAAIRLMQLARKAGRELQVAIVEKGSEVGAHILSGAVIETRALNELIPDWKEKGAPLHTRAATDEFLFLTQNGSFRLPTPPQMHNKGNYIASLGNLCRWLAGQAEELGVQIFPGFAAAALHVEGGRVAGIVTGDFGIGRDGEPKPGYQPGIVIKATYTLFAEGARGSLSEQLMKLFDLRKSCQPQTYGLGIKELWEIDPAKHKPGHVTHTIGWPVASDTYGGSFIYHLENNQLAIGYVVGLDYANPWLDPYLEFQRFKLHSKIRPLLEGGRRIAYGARVINEGGLQSVPGLVFPGGALTGCAAGFLNVPKIKGSHTAMKSGMLAAEAVFEALSQPEPPMKLHAYPEKLRKSWVWRELRRVRNIRPAFRFGLLPGLLYAALDTYLLRGLAPWTFRHHEDRAQLKEAKKARRIAYPIPDGKVTFDRLSSVYLSNTNHEEDQPVHLRLRDPEIPTAVNLPRWAEPATRYCPAGVYEIVEGETGRPRFQINAQNCVHCKTCDIKDPSANILWTVPEGGGGPNYPNM